MSSSIVIRKLRATDIDFISSTWLKNYWSESKTPQQMRKSVYFAEHHKLIHDHIVNSNFKVAVSKDEPDHIIGWLCFNSSNGCDYIHYGYSKHVFKDFDILSTLIASIRTSQNAVFTHDNIKKKLGAYYSDSVYNPYAFYNENYFN